MKRLRLIVLVCAMLFAVDAAAQPVYVMQSGTRTPQTCPNGFACSAAVDANNNVYVTSSGTPIPATISGGTVNVVATPGATSFLKSTDSTLWATGSNAVGVGGVRNVNRSVLADTELKWVPFGLSTFGAQFIDDNSAWHSGSTAQYSDFSEDEAVGNGTTVKLAGAQTQDPLSIDQSASGDAALFKVDRAGRLITAPYAPPGEYFSSCSSEITGTARTSIKAGVASNRIYVTSVTCSNNSTVPSRAAFSDAGGAVLAHGNVTALAGGQGFVASFPVPLRGSVNTDFSVTMTTTATATICCASGYISVN